MSNYETLRQLLHSGFFDDRGGGHEGESLLLLETNNALPAGRLTPDEAQSLLLEHRLRRVTAPLPKLPDPPPYEESFRD